MRSLPLLGGRARHFEPSAFVHINHQAAAIEASRVGAAKMVGSSDEFCGRTRNRNSAVIAVICCTRSAAAADHQPDNEVQECTAQIQMPAAL